MKKITEQQIKDLATKYKLSVAHIKTIIHVESSGSGFNADGSLKIQFEPRPFKKYTGIVIENKVDVQSKEYTALARAKQINEHYALMSTSWGMGQIMGFNHKLAGFDSVEKMIESFEESEYNQLVGMFNFLKNVNPNMIGYIKKCEWLKVAELYNGTGQIGYDKKLENAYKLFTNGTNKVKI